MYILLLLISERILTSFVVNIWSSDYLIKNDITVIDSYCFKYCRYVIKTILFEPEPQLERILDYAFSQCGLTTLDLSSCQKLKFIGNSAFRECWRISLIKLPPNLQEIGDYAFFHFGESEILNFPKSLKHIGKFAFSSGRINNMILPEGLEIIEICVFNANSFVKIEIPSSIKHIHEEAFSSCSKLETVNFKENSHLQSIGYNAFLDTKITKLELPNSVTHIAQLGIENFEINHPNFKNQSDFLSSKDFSIVFIYYGDSQNLVLDNVNEIYDYCFYQCKSLENISLPHNMLRIGTAAFEGCSHLISINIAAINVIEERAFYRCKSLSFVNLSNCLNPGIFNSYSFYKCNISHLYLPFGLKTIGEYSFSNNDFLCYVEFPSTLTHIYDSAFSGCSKLEQIIFHDDSQLQFIGAISFFGTNIKNISLPKSISNISKFTEKSIPISIHEENSFMHIKDGMIYNNLNSTALIFIGFQEDVTILDSVKYINDYCFYKNEFINHVKLPQKLERIGKEAFASCSNLVSMIINNVYIIDKSAFSWSNIEFIEINYVNIIQENVFSFCSNLKTVKIEKANIIKELCFSDSSVNTVSIQNIKVISDRAFWDCQELVSLTVTNVFIIDENSFYGCSKLDSVNILKLGRIVYNPFQDCNKLRIISDFKCENYEAFKDTLVSIKDKTVIYHAPKSVHKEIVIKYDIIYDSAFYQSENLETVFMPYVTEIQAKAFCECRNLKNLYFSNKLSSYDEGPIGNVLYGTNIENAYVLNNETSVIDLLVSVEIPREIIEPWSISMLPKDTAMITVDQVKHFRFFGVILKPFCEYISLTLLSQG